MKKSPLEFCSIWDRSVSSGGTLLPWVSITASLGVVKQTIGSKVPPLIWKKNLRDFSFPMMERDITGPVIFRYPVDEIIGSVFIWHMYPPWSICFTFLMVNCHRFPSRWITEIRVFRVIIRSSIVRISFVLTLIQAIWKQDWNCFDLCKCARLIKKMDKIGRYGHDWTQLKTWTKLKTWKKLKTWTKIENLDTIGRYGHNWTKLKSLDKIGQNW